MNIYLIDCLNVFIRQIFMVFSIILYNIMDTEINRTELNIALDIHMCSNALQ